MPDQKAISGQTGFTLTELAVVLAIIALLIGGMLLPLSAQIEARDNSDATKGLNDARDALLGYAASHAALDGKPYLPCPDTDDDGQENRSGNACTAAEGRLPWVDLGLGRVDPWQNRFRYRVTPAFSNNGVGFSLGSAGTLRVCVDSACSKILANNLPLVVLTHGKNGAGAFNSAGGTNAASTDANEIQNSNANDDFVSKIPDPGFDDIVVWLSPNLLFNRMIAAGRLP